MVPYMIIIPLSGRDNKDASGFQHLGTNCPEVVKTGERHTTPRKDQSSTNAESFFSRSDSGPHRAA